MPKRVRVNGVIYNVPENASMDQIQEYVTSKGATPPHTAHGASGSFTQPDIAQRAQINHPYLTAPAVGLAKIGKGAVDAATATAQLPGQVYHAFTDPLTAKEQADPAYSDIGSTFTNPVRRLLLEPQFKELEKGEASPGKFKSALHYAAAAVPGVGPMAAQIGERATAGDPFGALGEGLTFGLMPKLAEEGAGAVPVEAMREARADLPRKLLQRAEDIRSRQPVKLPGTGIGLKSSVIHRAAQEIGKRRPVAKAYEVVGEKLAGKDRFPLTRKEVAADEASRIRQANARDLAGPRTTFDAPSTETFPYPKPPTTIDAPVETAGRDFKSIEEKISPKGDRAKQAVQMANAEGKPTKFGKALMDAVPELKDAPKGAQADAVLKKGYDRALERINVAEDKIDPGKTVDTGPIVTRLSQQAADYLEKGWTKSADAIMKLQEEWNRGSEGMTWGEFIKKKRGFFEEHNLRKAMFRKAYGALMETSGRVSPELSKANAEYSTIRRALDAGKIDPQTGNRISAVGVVDKKPPGRLQETRQINQPVTSRAEAVERLNVEEPPAREDVEGEEPESEQTVPQSEGPIKRQESESLGKVGAGIRGESPSLTSTVDSRMRMIQEIAESGATETTGKRLGRGDPERGSTNYGTEQARTGGSGFIEMFPELESLGRTPSVIAKAIRQGKGPLFTQIREVVKDAMQDELQSLSGTGRGPGALRERALGVMRQRLPQP